MTTMVATLYVYVIDEKVALLIFVVSIDSSLIVCLVLSVFVCVLT